MDGESHIYLGLFIRVNLLLLLDIASNALFYLSSDGSDEKFA
jgi:hypothetical protein